MINKNKTNKIIRAKDCPPLPLACCDDMRVFYANGEVIYSHDFGYSIVTAKKDYVPVLFCPWCGQSIQDTIMKAQHH